MYFKEDYGVYGIEMWRNDGKPAGNSMVIDINTRGGNMIEKTSVLRIYESLRSTHYKDW